MVGPRPCFGGCLLPDSVSFLDARLGALFLPGCHAPGGIIAWRLRSDGDVHLRNEFRSDGPVDLGGARIGGQLDCTGGQFAAKTGRALNCGAAQIGAAVFLRGGFHAEGEVNFVGAEIGGQLACTGGHFAAKTGRALNCDAAQIGADVFLRGDFHAEGEINFVGAEIGGQLDCDGGHFAAKTGRALNCDSARIGADVFLRGGFHAEAMVNFVRCQVYGNFRVETARVDGVFDGEAMRVSQGFFWRDVTGARPGVVLTEAQVGSLRDEWASWDGVDAVKLSGFRYDRVENHMTIRQRLDWLKMARVHPFDPQPHVQLANVLSTQGDRSDASLILLNREHRQRRSARRQATEEIDGSVGAGIRSTQQDMLKPVNWSFRAMFGYGHRPARALLWALGAIVFSAWLYGEAFKAHQFAPNSDVVLTSAAWLDAVKLAQCPDKPDGSGPDDRLSQCAGPPPLETWLKTPAGRDYETFDRWLYGLDLFIPLDALGQELAWAPSATRGDLGWWAFYLRWVIQSLGWILTAVGAGVLTGLIGRRD